MGLVSITLLTTCWTLLRLEHGGPHAATVEGGRPLSPCLINASHPLCKRILIWNGVDRIETEAFGVGHQVPSVIERNQSLAKIPQIKFTSLFEL